MQKEFQCSGPVFCGFVERKQLYNFGGITLKFKMFGTCEQRHCFIAHQIGMFYVHGTPSSKAGSVQLKCSPDYFNLPYKLYVFPRLFYKFAPQNTHINIYYFFATIEIQQQSTVIHDQ